MKKNFGSDDDDDDDLHGPSSLLQTQRFPKSGTIGTKDFKMTQSKPKHNEISSLKIDLNRIHDDDDSLNDSDDDTNTKTGRSTSSGSQLTPKPKERSFVRNAEKPKVQTRRIDIDDDDRNVFGQTTIKPSPRHQMLTLREEEERNQSFIRDFRNEKRRQSPTDHFLTDHKSDSRRNSRKSPNDHDDKIHHDNDEENFLNRQTKQQHTFIKSRHSPTDSDKSLSRKSSNRSKDDSDQSDNDDLNKQATRHDYRKQRQSSHDLVQVI
jgi:hypothetical protein